MNHAGPEPGGRTSPSELAAGVRAGHRRALAKAITLVESTHPEDVPRALALLEELRPAAGSAFRVGVSGPPGAGKSTLIEALGLHLVEAGSRPAVLAVDPTSAVSGGSVLGDKTRMEGLARAGAAFVRPSPSAGAQGGVTACTPEVIEVCEAAGFDVVLVETVGVGQAEAEVAGMTDVFLLLEPPFAGDGLQAMKRGSVELADVVACTKADLDPAASAVACDRLNDALSLLHSATPVWRPRALAVSAQTAEGVVELWLELEACRRALADAGALAARRSRQAVERLRRLVDAGLRRRFLVEQPVRDRLAELEAAVARGEVSPAAAADELVAGAGSGGPLSGGGLPA